MSTVIKAWSYSSYKLFKTCRFAWKKRWIDGIKDTGYNPAMARGTEIHLKAEYFVKGKITGMPKELSNFAHEFKEIKKLGAVAEGDLAITKDLKPTHAKDWDGVWCRIKVDSQITLGDTATVIDYKTGQKYGDNEEQCGLYAVGKWVHEPAIKKVDTELWYLDKEEDNVELNSYTVREIKALIKDWKKKVAPMFVLQDEYPMNPCFACKFCIHASDKGGDCEFNSSGRRV